MLKCKKLTGILGKLFNSVASLSVCMFEIDEMPLVSPASILCTHKAAAGVFLPVHQQLLQGAPIEILPAGGQPQPLLAFVSLDQLSHRWLSDIKQTLGEYSNNLNKCFHYLGFTSLKCITLEINISRKEICSGGLGWSMISKGGGS